jgi:tRNA dimethylallyltransferase
MSELYVERRRPARWRARYLVVDPGAALAETIRARTRAMFEAGWREEVRSLLRTIPHDAPAWNASGYGAVRELEQGLIGEEEAMERVVIETRQYAKRQRTWFRHQLAGADVTHVAPDVSDARLAQWFNDATPVAAP